jgi:hypothetical protein
MRRSWRPTSGLAVAAVVLLLALPSVAGAHTLSLTQARRAVFDVAFGVAYSFDIASDPRLRCLRYNRSPHTVYCDVEFAPLNAAGIPGRSRCTWRHRVFLVGTDIRRAVVRPLHCRPQA